MSLLDALLRRGVRIHDPASTLLGPDLNPERFEAGAELFPGVALEGPLTAVGRRARIGYAGGARLNNVVVGRDVTLYGGYFEETALFDGCTIRGHAEFRGGTLLEEACEAAHHVGYKNTVQLPWTVAGSLINACDTIFCGGTSRKDHGEIGSCLAIYNYTPWGDKFASVFGEVHRGLFLDCPRIFLGGQTRVVSPVRVGFGAVIPAGMSVRRDVPENRLYGEADPASVDQAWDPARLGAITPKVDATLTAIGSLHVLDLWYRTVRTAWAEGDPFRSLLVLHGLRQLRAHRAERERRLLRFLERVPASARAWDDESGAVAARRRAEHAAWLERTPTLEEALARAPEPDLTSLWKFARSLSFADGYVAAIQGHDPTAANDARAVLQSVMHHHRTLGAST